MTKLKVHIVGLAAVICLPAFVIADDYQARFFSVKSDPVHQQTTLQAQLLRVLRPVGFSDQNETFGGGILETRSGKKISRGGAMLRSLIVPGWGESYLGYHKTARWFFWTDVALWATVIGLETYSRWKEDQFISFAATHAGANLSGKSDSYYADIGNYNSTEDYNEAKLRNRDYDALYTNPDDFWAWDSDTNRMDYDHLRIQSRSAHNRVYFFMGAAALNRLISFIDTGKKAQDLLKRKHSPQLGLHVQPGLEDGANSVRLVLSAEF